MYQIPGTGHWKSAPSHCFWGLQCSQGRRHFRLSRIAPKKKSPQNPDPKSIYIVADIWLVSSLQESDRSLLQGPCLNKAWGFKDTKKRAPTRMWTKIAPKFQGFGPMTLNICLALKGIRMSCLGSWSQVTLQGLVWSPWQRRWLQFELETFQQALETSRLTWKSRNWKSIHPHPNLHFKPMMHMTNTIKD